MARLSKEELEKKKKYHEKRVKYYEKKIEKLNNPRPGFRWYD